MNAFQLDLYKDAVLKITRGYYQGNPVNAKPILLIAMLDGIDNDLLKNNKIVISDELIQLYKETHIRYNSKVTPFYKPFYYLQFDEFWHLRWIDKEDLKTLPNLKFLRCNVEYAYLDNALWDLLQDKETRDLFRQTIENYYLKI